MRSVVPDGSGHLLGPLKKVSTTASNYSANPCCTFGNDHGDYTGIDATQGAVLPVWSDKHGRRSTARRSSTPCSRRTSCRRRSVRRLAGAGGDGDGVLEPGESFRLAKALRNDGAAAATAVTATLSRAGRLGHHAHPADLGVSRRRHRSDAVQLDAVRGLARRRVAVRLVRSR